VSPPRRFKTELVRRGAVGTPRPTFVEISRVAGATCELTGDRGGDFTDLMRFLFVGIILATLAVGCAHQKTAAPLQNFSDVPGLPPDPVPVPVEVKQKPKPQPKEKNTPPVEAKRKPKPQPKETKVETAAASAEPKATSQKLIVTPETGLVGKVETANQNLRYVVLSFPIGHLPAMEQRLNVYRHGLKVGEVKVTGPQIEDNVVADIVDGDSGPGDEVRDK
jgi:hypothetical protein